MAVRTGLDCPLRHDGGGSVARMDETRFRGGQYGDRRIPCATRLKHALELALFLLVSGWSCVSRYRRAVDSDHRDDVDVFQSQAVIRSADVAVSVLGHLCFGAEFFDLAIESVNSLIT